MNKQIETTEERKLNQKFDILQRTLDFSLKVIEFYQTLDQSEIGKILGKQFLRSATSVGANLQEAQGGQSKADFISKVSIAYKEIREANYWLELIDRSSIGCDPLICEMLKDETSELSKIPSTILLNSKRSNS